MRAYRTTRRLLLAAALAAAPPAARAGEPAPDLSGLDLESLMDLRVETVSAASKHEQSVGSAPASVTVVTRDEIRDLGCRTLADVLAGVRGLFVTYDRNYTYLGVRGFQRPGDYNSRILLLVDGHAWNEDIWDSALIGPEFGVDLELVERVEVVRGPSSSMYGGNAFFGIVNVVTRKPASVRSGELSATASSFRGVGGRASAAATADGGAEVLASISASDVAGPDLRYAEYATAGRDGWTRGNDWERWGSFLAKASWRGLALEVAGVRRDKGVPTGSYGALFGDPYNSTSDRRLFAELRWEFAPASAVDATVRGYYDLYTFNEGYALANDGAAPLHNLDDDRGRWVGAELKTVSRLGAGWLLVAGAEGKYHLLQELRNYDVGGATWLLDRRSAAAGSVYAQVEAPLAGWLEATAGARYDALQSDEALSPRAALIATPAAGTTVKALYGRAFRAPNDAELHYGVEGFWKAPPGLRPERMTTYELAFEQRVGAGTLLSAVGYRYDARELVSQAVDAASGLTTYANVHAVRATGLELEAEQRFARGVVARASWALQRSDDGDTGERVTNSPTHLAKLQLHGPLGWRGLRGGAEVLYMSARQTLSGTTDPGHALVNLNLLAARVGATPLDLALSVHNVLDARYADPGSREHVQDAIAQDGRTFRLQATWRW
jgi:outer membrane receptor protein involved in Fe transport